jgi:hypothetical protein
MDKVAQYRDYVRKLMTRYAESDVSDDEVEVELILDEERDRYLWMNVGWQQFKRIYCSIIHIDIKKNLASAKSNRPKSG